ncbi:hypothetical protein MSAN_02443800 [Mycena sanguinolenta]|uniref:Uncharacterized protein n=1 Tax=Mycena sanguinolenta TaxID=230812 RepID=A0A8H6WYQ0_9AGAR|nr:hypothetical protein MSAN_02443800 [Mycena sanguinolenta]
MAWSKERRKRRLWTHRGSISNCISTRTSAFTLAVAVRLQAAPLSVRPPNRSSSPHLSLRGCSEGGNDHRPTTFGNVATHVCLRTTSSAGACSRDSAWVKAGTSTRVFTRASRSSRTAAALT